MNDNLIIFKDKGDVYVDSRDVARILGREHKNILSTIRELNERNSRLTFEPSTYISDRGKEYRNYILNESQTMFLLMNLSHSKLDDIKLDYILEFNRMKEELTNERFKHLDIGLQKHLHSVVHDVLPPELVGEKTPYMAANSTINKATSNYHGFTTMIKKGDMTPEMLITRQKVLNDYVKYVELYGSYEGVKDFLYKKYQLPQLTGGNDE